MSLFLTFYTAIIGVGMDTPVLHIIHSQALIVQDGPLTSLSGFLDHTHTDTR
jgi:hypothetical protein